MVVWLSDAAARELAVVGSKAARLAAALAAGLRVPDGFVVPVGEARPDAAYLVEAAGQVGASLAVRSSAVAEDLAGSSFAGMYESYLHVPPMEVPAAVQRCRRAAGSDRVAAYRAEDAERGVAVLVQVMVAADAAGVAFTADPLTGASDQVVITAVAGVAEELVGGEAGGEEWRVVGTAAAAAGVPLVLTAGQAVSIAAVARRLEVLFGGPQDVEWAVTGDQVHILQSRPMTALPQSVTWTPPGAGLWACNFRLGEWMTDPVTPLFADWLLPVFDRGFRAAMRDTAGAVVPFPYGLVNGWYYSTPNPEIAQIPGALLRSGGGLLRFMIETVVLPGGRPVIADRTLDRLYRDWRDRLLPDYQRLAAVECDQLGLAELTGLVERIVDAAGYHFWYLAVVGGAAWKMEQAIQTFLSRQGLTDVDAAVLLSSLDPPTPTLAHAVHSLDWFHPVAGECRPLTDTSDPPATCRPAGEARRALEQRCVDHFAHHPRAGAEWAALIAVARKYVRIREEQTSNLTLAWPLLRSCAARLGQMSTGGAAEDPALLFFLTHAELQLQRPATLQATARRREWLAQRKLTPPLTLGRPPALIGHHLVATVGADRAGRSTAEQLVGQPASPGRATGPARIVRDPTDFAMVQPGDVIVASATTPAWTPLFSRAAAVVTDRGSAAAHASIIAREYGIPAVVATGDATRRLRDGVTVTVDGGRGVVTIIDI